MLHAVLTTIEVKTRMTSNEIRKGWQNARTIMEIANEVKGYGPQGWKSLRTEAIAYRLAQRLQSTTRVYNEAATPTEAGFDVHILRIPERDQPVGGQLGADLHMEPINRSEYMPTCRLTHTTLSDVYYMVVQDSYYSLAERNWTYTDIGVQVMDYMNWATCSWDEYESLLANRLA